MLSVLDIFRVGIGPSSSHTVGPIRSAHRFVKRLEKSGVLGDVDRLEVRLQGSLAFTGAGHATPSAVIFGLLGHQPETIDIEAAREGLSQVEQAQRLLLLGEHAVRFEMHNDMVFDYDTPTDLHPNRMQLAAFANDTGNALLEEVYYSTGGGFIATEQQLLTPAEGDLVPGNTYVAYPFGSAEELLAQCSAQDCSIADIIIANEDGFRPRKETCERLDRIIEVMMACVERGLHAKGELPGSLKVKRRASDLWSKLQLTPQSNERERIFDWLNVYAMAVNEENASGGQVVTAPTNGAAGIIPAILRHYCWEDEPRLQDARKFMLTAGGIGLLYKQRASISGAEMGCQGEVGVACSMAAGGLAAVWGGSPEQVANAAEIGMEHNLGLTCDPVGGLVQIPCIERNAIGATKAANAARLALHRSETTHVSLDQVIETMRQTGLDMSSKYKETSQGGLAVNVVEC